MVAHHSNYINDRVRQIITGRNFFDDLKILAFVLSPIRETVLALEGKKATLGTVFSIWYDSEQQLKNFHGGIIFLFITIVL
jgi:hypothetical protein